jgi:hypothetical protein
MLLCEKNETKRFHTIPDLLSVSSWRQQQQHYIHLLTHTHHVLHHNSSSRFTSVDGETNPWIVMEFTESYKQTGPSSFSPNARFLAVAVDYRLVIRDTFSFKVR